MRICQIPRSQQFSYFQNKALHYDKLKNAKPAIDDRQGGRLSPKSHRYINSTEQSPANGVTLGNNGTQTSKGEIFLRNLKLRHTIQKNTIRQNEHLRQRLIKIMNSSQGYARTYQIDRSFTKNRKDKINRERELALDNQGIAERIVNAKAAIGDGKSWSKHYDKFMNNTRQISKFDQTNNMKSKIHIHQTGYIPHQFSTILDQQDFEQQKSKKGLRVQYERLMRLPKMRNKDLSQTKQEKNSGNLKLPFRGNINQKSQSIDLQGASNPSLTGLYNTNN